MAISRIMKAACCDSPQQRTGRRAVHVDPEARERNLSRLKRIEGQVRGVHRMVAEERYCADVLGQISAIHEALRAVGRELMRNHLRYCAADAIRHGGAEAETVCNELVELMYKNAR
jgi:CsoR family transcriptional regulator, copper-sensing transcriptional repressor